MFELEDLYQQLILDHNKSPRNYGAMESFDRDAEGYNPLCGDRYRVYVTMDGDRVEDVSFEGDGCAISKSAASLMTEAVKGRTIGEIAGLFEKYRDLVTGKAGTDADMEELGKMAVFSGVSEFPVRVKCAILAWRTLQAALQEEGGSVTTE